MDRIRHNVSIMVRFLNIKKCLFGGFLVAASLFIQSGTTYASESIAQFQANYTINTDGSVAVVETITYDFDNSERHGLFRTLSLRHAESATAWYKNRDILFTITDVTRDGVREPYTIEGSTDQPKIKIGDGDVTITGQHTYQISYKLQGTLSYHDDGGVELYWNVTGNDWEVPLESVVVTVAGVPVTTGFCYRTGQECLGELETDTYTVHATTLRPGEELTIAVALPPEAVAKTVFESLRLELLFLPLMFFIVGSTLIALHRYRRQYDDGATIVVEYEPYAEVEPMMAGILLDNTLDARDISAGIMYLAEQGFFKIKQTERPVLWLFNVKDYEVTLCRPVSDISSAFLLEIAQLMFAPNDVVGTVVPLSAIKYDPRRQQANQTRLTALRKAINNDLKQAGYYEYSTLSFWMILAFMNASLVFSMFLYFFTVPVIVSAFIWCVLICGVMYGFGTFRRQTAKSFTAARHLAGFKLFLSVTDRERFAFHNAPERNPEQFMQFLPYAVAFGVEDAWANIFADMEISNPTWYESQAGTPFAAAALAHDIGAFSTAVASSTRASGGGGSAGGGGGGGGGGSW